jgi:hypothetical protein
MLTCKLCFAVCIYFASFINCNYFNQQFVAFIKRASDTEALLSADRLAVPKSQLSRAAYDGLPEWLQQVVLLKAIKELIREADYCESIDYLGGKEWAESYAAGAFNMLARSHKQPTPVLTVMLELSHKNGKLRREIAQSVRSYYLEKHKHEGIPVALALFDPRYEIEPSKTIMTIMQHGTLRDLDAYTLLFEKFKHEMDPEKRDLQKAVILKVRAKLEKEATEKKTKP